MASNDWGTQLAYGWEDNANQIYQRNVTGGSWSAWVRYLNSGNYNSYAPTLTGGGASGTWSINVTGSAGSTSYLSALGSYVWNASTPATSYFLGITSSFVSSAQGWIDYGSLMTVMTYPGGGGTLQLYTPYSTVYGGSRLVYRSSDYNTGTWTGWKYLLNDSSDPYAANMNQYVRTSDSPTFNTLYAADSIRFNQGVSVDTNNTFGIYFGSDRSVAYGIYRASGAWTHPYPDLRIAMHTGIQMGANASYGGMRFYSDYDMSTMVASINDGDTNMRGYYDIIAYASDKRLKHNIQPIENALSKVKLLTGMTYQWNELGRQHGWEPDMEIREAGVFAQDVQAVLPEAVRLAPFDNDKGVSKSGENFLTVKYEKIVPLLIEAIKEQQIQIEELKAKLNES